MTRSADDLTRAFQADHAILGRGLHELTQWLRVGNAERAAGEARRLDADAGAHIAFEEEHFYPVLRTLIGDREVDQMYQGHEEGLGLLRRVIALPADQPIDKDTRNSLLEAVAEMERHVSECGEVFAALGRIPTEEQTSLLRELLTWRRRAPSWSDYAAGISTRHRRRAT